MGSAEDKACGSKSLEGGRPERATFDLCYLAP